MLNESLQGVRAHPALVELRQQRMAFTKLVAALAIPADDAAPGSQKTRTGLRAVK